MFFKQITRQANTTKSRENVLKDENEVDIVSKLKAQLRDQEKLVVYYFIYNLIPFNVLFKCF